MLQQMLLFSMAWRYENLIHQYVATLEKAIQIAAYVVL